MFERISLVFVALLFLISMGCGGGDTVPVNGTVTLDGIPLANANVVFHAVASGRPAVARTNASGQFSLSSIGENDGAYPGDYTITIVAVSETPAPDANVDPMKDLDQHIENGMKELNKEQNEMQPRRSHESLVHENYTSVAKSPLEITVPNDGPIELKLTHDGT